MVRDIRHRRPFDPHGRVVPADPSPRDVRRRVPGIAPVEGQVDAAHERNAAVDHDRLLVVAVRESRAAVRVRLDLRVPGHAVEHVADVVLRRLEERHGRALPGEQPHVDLLCELGEEVADDHRLVVSREVELGREVPTGQMDEGLGARELGRHGRQCLRAVDEDVETIALAHREGLSRVREIIGVERMRPAHVPQALTMTVLDGLVEPLPERVPELDGRRLEDPRRLGLPRDGVRGPRRPPRSRRVIVLVRHLLVAA